MNVASNRLDNGLAVMTSGRSNTMTYEEIKAAVEQWPVAERLRLVEEISHSVRETLEPATPTSNGRNDDDAAWRKAFEAERAELLKGVPHDSSLHQILGIARTREKIPMTKEEDREAILEYLIEKYG
jgi:hypothetical protein